MYDPWCWYFFNVRLSTTRIISDNLQTMNFKLISIQKRRKKNYITTPYCIFSSTFPQWLSNSQILSLCAILCKRLVVHMLHVPSRVLYRLSYYVKLDKGGFVVQKVFTGMLSHIPSSDFWHTFLSCTSALLYKRSLCPNESYNTARV